MFYGFFSTKLENRRAKQVGEVKRGMSKINKQILR
jgi:hypothetical protein